MLTPRSLLAAAAACLFALAGCQQPSPSRPAPWPWRPLVSSPTQSPAEAPPDTEDPYRLAAERIRAILEQQKSQGRLAVVMTGDRTSPILWHCASVLPVYLEKAGLDVLARRDVQGLIRREGASIWTDPSPDTLAAIARAGRVRRLVMVRPGARSAYFSVLDPATRTIDGDGQVEMAGEVTHQFRPFPPAEPVDAVMIAWTAALRREESRQALDVCRTMAEGDMFFDMGLWAESEACYALAVQRGYGPAHLPALLAARHIEERLSDAVGEVERLLRTDRTLGRPLRAVHALLLAAKGETEESQSILLALAREDVRALYLAGMLFDTPGVADRLSAAAARGDAQAQTLLARDLLNEGKLEAAIAAAQDVVRRDDRAAGGYEVLAAACMAKGDVDTAASAARAAVMIDPEAVGARETLAQALILRKAFDAALETLDEGVEAAPFSEILLLRKADLQLRLRMFDRAERSYRAALALRPSLEYARQQIASLFLLKGEPARAAAVLGETPPSERGTRYVLLMAEALAGLRKPDEAVRLLRPLTRTPAAEIQARLLLGQILLESGNRPAALNEAQMAANRATQTQSRLAGAAYAGLARVMLALGETEDADGASAEALRRSPSAVGVLLARASVLVALGRLDEAARLAAEARATEPFDPAAYEALGDVASARGLWSLAAQYWQTAMALSPAGDSVAWKLAEMYHSGGRDPALARLYYELCARRDGPHARAARDMLDKMAAPPAAPSP